MNKLTLIVLVFSSTFLAGCDPASSTSEQVPNSESVHDHDHDHDHDHGGATDHSVEGHAHGAGPHGGTIVDWGGGTYHVELTVDHDLQKATTYVLGGDEKTPSPIDAESIELGIKTPELLLTLQPEPQADDPPGKSSCYVGTHESLATVADYRGTITGLVDGTPYSGDFVEESR